MNQSKLKIIIIVTATIVVLVIIFLTIYNNRKLNIVVTSGPVESNIIINNDLKTSPAHYQLKPGTYTIWATKTGYQEFKQDYKITKNNQQINIELSIENQTDIPNEGVAVSPNPQPQISNLPFVNDRLTVSWDNKLSKYLIVPNIPFTNTESPENQIKNNWSQYEQHAQEALRWIKEQGVQPSNQNIEFWGKEWWPQDKTISF